MERDERAVESQFARALMPPQDAAQLFRSLAEAPARTIEALRAWLASGPMNLSLADNARFFSERLPPEEKNRSIGLCGAYFRLESLRRALGWPGDEFANYLAEQCADGKPNRVLPEESLPPLRALFTPTEWGDLLYKARRLYDGDLPSYVESFTTVEFRPVFGSNMEVAQGLLATFLELVVREPDETSSTKRIALQVDRKDIEDLEQVLARAKQKLLKMQAMLNEHQINLLNPKVGLEEKA